MTSPACLPYMCEDFLAACRYIWGCMIWIVVAELLPDALEGASAETVATAATMSAAALEAFRMLMSALENDDGTFHSPFRTAGGSTRPNGAAAGGMGGGFPGGGGRGVGGDDGLTALAPAVLASMTVPLMAFLAAAVLPRRGTGRTGKKEMHPLVVDL